MKTFAFGIIFLGFTNLLCAQNDVAVLDINNDMAYISDLSNETAIVNQEYLNNITELSISRKVLKLQNIVANYDIKADKVYSSKSKTTYTVNFTEGLNQLKAIYDRNGQLLSSQESYQSIRLPYEFSSKLIKEHPGWTLSEVYCNIEYNKDTKVDIKYTVILKNGRKTKTIKINS